MNTLAAAATDAAILLNNAAIRAPEPEWRRVQEIVNDLERLADDQSPARRFLRRLRSDASS